MIEKLNDYSDGSGITLSVDTSCTFFNGVFGSKDKTIENLISSLIDGECALNEAIEELKDSTDAPFSFDTSCLTVSAGASRDEILQAAILKICSIYSRVEDIEDDYVKATELDTLIAQYITNSSSTTVQYNTKAIPYVAMPYHGPLSNFDGSGKGLLS